tara:strand:- start:174 stop:452 length:279 start_codon:yes stop_codon:yes gene_type:complete
VILNASVDQLATVSLLLQLEAALDLQQPLEAACLADIGHALPGILSILDMQQLADVLSSNAARVAEESAFWAQPAAAMATQIPIVASIVFIG